MFLKNAIIFLFFFLYKMKIGRGYFLIFSRIFKTEKEWMGFEINIFHIINKEIIFTNKLFLSRKSILNRNLLILEFDISLPFLFYFGKKYHIT